MFEHDRKRTHVKENLFKRNEQMTDLGLVMAAMMDEAVMSSHLA